ncbi:MAG: hypothetical protein IT317_17695 [Anaerolineales bacterium]|nr:hypothetical protein [Anaerolineales bacterium]
MPVIDLQYLIPDKMKQIHPDWKTLKGKYAEIIKTRKIVFDKKLGPMLDTRYTLHKQISAFKAGGSALIVKGQLNSFKTNAKALKAAAALYQTRVKGLGAPSGPEFTAFLTKVGRAAANDILWADGKLAAMMTPKKK